MEQQAQGWQHHEHDALEHRHEHHHVTHNLNQRTGGFDHLSSAHDHDHDHARLGHAHFPHKNFDHEHQFEAHDHDHGEPVKRRAPAKETPQKAVSTAKQDGEKKAAPRRTRSS